MDSVQQRECSRYHYMDESYRAESETGAAHQ